MVLVLFWYHLYFFVSEKKILILWSEFMQIGDKNSSKMIKWDQIMEMGQISENQKAQGATWHWLVMPFRYSLTWQKFQRLLGNAEEHHLTILSAVWALGSHPICINLAKIKADLHHLAQFQHQFASFFGNF